MMTAPELLAARTALGLTQGALATSLGVGRRTVQHWEAGERAVPEPIARILRASVVDADVLYRISVA